VQQDNSVRRKVKGESWFHIGEVACFICATKPHLRRKPFLQQVFAQ
jgi:hypothetical protein